jgi:hypothetical protein
MSNLHRPRQFDLIAFDWDGTLYDSTQIIVRCIQAAVTDVGGQTPTHEQAAYVIGMALMPALAHAAPDVPKEKYPSLASATDTTTPCTTTICPCLKAYCLCLKHCMNASTCWRCHRQKPQRLGRSLAPSSFARHF